MEGWIKLHRKLLDNPVVCKDADHIAVWTYLLLNATHKQYDVIFEGTRKTINAGQLLTGRKSISSFLKISESKVQRILKTFEIEQQIEQQTTSRNRLISILSWMEYQSCEQQDEQQVNNKRTTSEQQVNTNKNVKNIKNVINKNIVEVDDFFESIWKLYPNKLGKNKVSKKSKKELSKLGFDTIKKAIEIYSSNKPEWKQYQNGSTFFNGGYMDYLENNYAEVKEKSPYRKYDPFTDTYID